MKKLGLEDMKAALSKYKSKDESFSNSSTLLQSKIEKSTAELLEVQNMINQSKSDIVEKRESHVEDLQKKVLEEQEKVQALIEKVTTSETLIRADTPAKEALDEATKIKKNFEISVKKMSQFKGYLEVLELPATPIPEIEEFE
jgi:transcription termination factor NusB